MGRQSVAADRKTAQSQDYLLSAATFCLPNASPDPVILSEKPVAKRKVSREESDHVIFLSLFLMQYYIHIDKHEHYAPQTKV